MKQGPVFATFSNSQILWGSRKQDEVTQPGSGHVIKQFLHLQSAKLLNPDYRCETLEPFLNTSAQSLDPDQIIDLSGGES